MRNPDDLSEREWAKVWAIWAGYFAVAEYYALKSKNPRAPLSWHLRKTLGIRKHRLHYWAGHLALGGGAVWLIRHLHEAMEEIKEP